MKPSPPPDRDPPHADDRRRSKPTPVRALHDVEGSPAEEPAPPAEETSITIEGIRWHVRVAGEAEGPGDASGPRRLFLRFDQEGMDGDDASAKSAWIVGDLLADLPEARIEAAFRQAKPWAAPDRELPFFEDESGRRGR